MIERAEVLVKAPARRDRPRLEPNFAVSLRKREEGQAMLPELSSRSFCHHRLFFFLERFACFFFAFLRALSSRVTLAMRHACGRSFGAKQSNQEM